MRVLLCLFTVLFLFPALLHSPAFAVEDRFAECDACGYCRNRPAPENWNECAACLYSGSGVTGSTRASENKTLLVDQNSTSPTANKPPAPALGKYYTQLGCVNMGLDSFRDPSAAGGVLNFLLTNLILPAVGTLAFATIIYGGFMLATAQGEQLKIMQGRRLVLSAIVGLVFTFSSVLIINTVGNDILRIPGMSGGTKVTFVGWGEPTIESGQQTYPDISVVFYGKEVGKIESIQGSASAQETREVYLPAKIDLSTNIDIQKVQLVFINDLCLSRTGPGRCCLISSPPPVCTNLANTGDRNIHNIRIMFDDKVCMIRKLGSKGTINNTDGSDLANNWGNEYYVCDALAP